MALLILAYEPLIASPFSEVVTHHLPKSNPEIIAINENTNFYLFYLFYFCILRTAVACSPQVKIVHRAKASQPVDMIHAHIFHLTHTLSAQFSSVREP